MSEAATLRRIPRDRFLIGDVRSTYELHAPPPTWIVHVDLPLRSPHPVVFWLAFHLLIGGLRRSLGL